MFFKAKEKPQELTVNELIGLNNRLDEYLILWINKELSNDAVKLKEMTIANLKIFYADADIAKTMRDFFFNKNELEKGDYFISRIHDLYLVLQTSFPPQYLEHVERRFLETLIDLHYPVDDRFYEQFPLVWLLHKVQHVIRYQRKAV